MQHPTIDRIESTGYPYSERREISGTDGLGREVFEGEEIIEFMGEFYLVEELSVDAREILGQHGGLYKIAK